MQDYYELLDVLNRYELTDPKKYVDNILDKWNKNKLLDVVGKLIKSIRPSNTEVDISTSFTFSANSTLSGAPFPCADIACRLNNVEKLVRFSALYCDKVYIQSPFDEYLRSKEIDRNQLVGDITILNMLVPLIKQNLIGFVCKSVLLCEDCLIKFTKQEDAFNTKYKLLEEYIYDEYLSNVKCQIRWTNTPVIVIQAPEKYGFHKSVVLKFNKIPKEIQEVGKKNKTLDLPKDLIRQYVLPSITYPIKSDLLLHNVWIHGLGTNYLTNREIDTRVLDALHNENKQSVSQQMFKGLTHNLPVLSNINMDTVLKVRKEEGEAFLVYRDALTSLLRKDALDTKDLKEAFQDIVQPEINKINLIFKNNQKSVLGSLKTDACIAVGVIGIGLYSGIFAPDVSKLISNIGICSVGGIAFISNEYAKIKRLINGPEEIKDNKYYFLWRLEQENKSRREVRGSSLILP